MHQLSPLFLRYCLLAACAPALAEPATELMMPDGSKDMYVGLAFTTKTAAAEGQSRPLILRPLLQVQWSNGVFASASGVLGMHLSRSAGVEYGPLIVASDSRQPSDSWRLRGTHVVNDTLDGGAFVNYYFGHAARLTASLLYDTSAHGLRAYVGWQNTVLAPAPHHTLTWSAGVALASDPVMRELYEVRLATGGVRNYRPEGGVMAANVGLNWNWALSSKWLVNSSLSGSRLGNGPAAAPFVERRSFITWSSGLGYRF